MHAEKKETCTNLEEIKLIQFEQASMISTSTALGPLMPVSTLKLTLHGDQTRQVQQLSRFAQQSISDSQAALSPVLTIKPFKELRRRKMSFP